MPARDRAERNLDRFARSRELAYSVARAVRLRKATEGRKVISERPSVGIAARKPMRVHFVWLWRFTFKG